MKRFLSFILLIIMLSFSSVAIGNQPLEKSGEQRFSEIHLTWSDNPKTTQTISWRTDASVMVGKVQFAKSGSSKITTVDSNFSETLKTNIRDIKIFTVNLKNLQSGTEYQYRVGDGSYWSDYSTFRTEESKTDEFEFIVFGDSHEKKADYTVWADTVNKAYNANPKARFMVSLGDLIYAGKDYEQWQKWFLGAKNVINRIPDMPVIGDHEPRGVTSKQDGVRPEYFTKLFNLPQNGPEKFKGEVYSFDYGPAHCVVLNSSFTYEFKTIEDQEAMIKAECEWLDKDLAATKKTWKLVFYHDASYNLNSDRSGTLTKRNFGPILDKYHADVVFNAHEHAAARSYPIKNDEFVANPKDGTVYYVSGRSGNNQKEGLGQKIWHPFFYDPQSQTCYLSVKVEEDELIIITRLADGTVVDKYVIDKESPSDSTPTVPFGKYEEPRMALFGTLITFGKAPEQANDEKWYIDLKALTTFLNGKFDVNTNIFSYNEDEINLQLNDSMFLDAASKEMVSLEGLTSVGFDCKYHEATNTVMIERYRP